MSKTIKTVVATIAIIAGAAAPAHAADYSMKVKWDDTLTAAQNYESAAEKIEQFCTIQVRRAGDQRTNFNRAVDHCEAELMESFVKTMGDAELIEYYTERKDPSSRL